MRTKQRACLSIYWPGIDNDIDNIILACQTCHDGLPSNAKEPLIQKPQPVRPFQEITIDVCSYVGRVYLIIVDCLQAGQQSSPWIMAPPPIADKGPTPVILPHHHPQHCTVGWWAPVHLKHVSSVCSIMRILPQGFNTTLPSM